MVHVDWKKMMAITPEGMTEEEKDDLYESVAWYIPDLNLDRKYLVQFIRVVQEVLKFKAEQVESLMNELDDIASKQGEEEARRRQDLLDEIEDLKEQLEYHKRLDQDGSRPLPTSHEELKSEVVKLEMQNEELLFELQEREKELMNEKTEIENYASQVATLEREKLELMRELTALQEETTEKLNAKSLRDSPEFGPEKQEELTEVIRQKNKHITQLLDDIDIVEKENLSLRTKLNSVRDELAETTTHITEMTGEMSRLRHVIEDYEKKFESLEEQKKGLVSQIEELVEEKARHDKQLDEFAVTLNSKVQEWKDVLDSKDKEITKYKDEIKRLMASSSMLISSDFGEMEVNQKVIKQEEEIKLLKKELLKATEELNKCSELIEQLKEKKDVKLPDGGQVAGLEDRIRYLEEKLKYAEEDAHAKAEEMSELVIQLREYEAGEFGLSDAVAKIKKLEKVVQKKDAQIEKLIESCNNLEIEFENLEEQNMTLRERLGLSATDEIDTSHVKLKFKKDVEMIENLKLQLEKKEEDLIKVKLKNRKLIKYLKLKPPVSLDSVSSDDSRSDGKKMEKYKQENSDLEKKLLSIIKENDALRKGMHEILESIHNQDGSGTVEVQSACLERLLDALDCRHVSGWYHPAMRLQAQLKSVEGKNEELRNQIRSLRIEDNKKIEELKEAYAKIQTLESDVIEVKSRSKSSETGDDEEAEDEEDGEIIVKTVTNIEQEQKITELEMELQQLKFLYDKKNSEADSMEYTLKTEKEELNIKIAGLESQIKELESKREPDEVKSAEMASNLIILERKVNFLGNLETMLRLTTEKLREEMIETEERILQDVIRIQSDKLAILLKVENLEKILLKSVPKERFDSVNKELIETMAKYQEAVNLSITKYDDGIIEKLQKEIELLKNEKQEILDELRIHKEKLIAAESVANGDMVTQDAFSNEISVLSGKLAASEVRELNEKQKSTHLENVNLMIRSELQELEAHNKDLTEYIGKLTEANNKLRETERELRGKVTRDESEGYNELSEKLEVLENKYKELLIEKDNVQELFEISQGQCRALQNWRDIDKLQMASQNEEILNLQSGNDDKMIIARLSHELLTSQLTTAQLTKKNSDLQNRVSKLLTRNICLEAKIDEDKREAFDLKWKHLIEVEYLYEVINDVRKLYGNVIMFPDVESVYNAKIHLQNERNDLRVQLDELKIKLHEYSIKREECEVQLEALNDLKSALQGDNKNLITWHNRSTEFRLKEARYRRQNEFLIGEMSQLEKCVKKLNEEITNLEEKSIEREKAWEQKQIIWEETQYELCQLLQEKGIKRTPTPIVTYCDQGTDADNKTVSTENIEHFVRIIDDQTEAIKKYETQIQDLESELLRLKKELDEKETIIMLKEKLMNNSKPKTLELEETVSRDKSDEAEKSALKVTVQSLQNIIKQKEETIFRYQDLLKEGRDEYSKASGKLQEELRTLHETLTNQSKAYNRLKNSIQASQQSKDNIPVALEKYITKIHELEDELIEARSNLTNMNSQLYAVQQEADRWRSVAEDRLLLMEDMRQRLEVEYRNEMGNFKEEIQAYQGEIDHLKQLLDAGHGDVNHGHNHKLMETIQQQQIKLLQYEGSSGKKASDWMLDKSIKNKTVQAQREIDSLKRQLKFSKDESARLREQIRLLQLSKPHKRPRTGSSTTRSGSDSKNSIKEESLLSKIKTLEELLQISKERERELLESSQQRLKSAEEVARWDEKKRCQQTIDQLNSKLKEKDVEIEVLKNKNESFRNMIHRCERERNILESQLKAAKGGPGGPSAKIEKLKCDKLALEAEVSALRKQLEDQERHESGYGAALLHEKLEYQERKLAVLELASHGRDEIVNELERLKTINTSLEKVNLKLESDNLTLSLNLEKEKAELKRLAERNKQLEKLATLQQATEDVSELHQLESDRTISSLHQTIEKLTADNKRLRNMQNKEPRSYGTVEKVRKDLLKLKEEHKNLRAKYLQVVDRNSALEDELKKCRYQICLLEEKDLADSISKTNNLQLASDLSQELLQVKSQLAHKTHLLERVKVLLTKAAAKEKALNEQVSVLQSMVPASAIRESC